MQKEEQSQPAVARGPARETREREDALRRAEIRARSAAGDGPGRDPHTGLGSGRVAARAFTALADGVRDYAIFLLDREGTITFWGEGARLMKWWSRDQAEGAHLRMLYPDGGSEDGTAEAHLREAAEKGEYTGEGQRIRSDGSTFWAGVTLTALRDDGGELIGFAKVARDLTARRAADATLKAARDEAEKARRRAEEANQAKTLFLASMSHEIRTPINAVTGYVDLLDMEIPGPLTEAQRRHLARIRASNIHLLGIIDEVLDFSRLDAGRVSFERRAGRLGSPVEGALQMVALQAEGKGVTLSDSVSAFAAGVPYRGDEDRVRQILVILLSNAVKFTPSGGRITVSAGAAAQPPSEARLDGPGPWVYVRIEDTGPGVPPDRTAAIFEPFEQADMTLTRQHGGTGLGLAIAKRLATLMDGDLTLRSRPGMGSAFFLWLPAAAEDAAEPPHATDVRMDAPGPGLLRELRDVLLAELERVVQRYVGRLQRDDSTPAAHTLGEAELEDHLATLLADVAETFHTLDLSAVDAGPERGGATEIQRTIAEQHGRLRRRQGWREAELRREFEILREEVSAAVRRRMDSPRAGGEEEATDAVLGFIEAAESTSVESYRAGAS